MDDPWEEIQPTTDDPEDEDEAALAAEADALIALLERIEAHFAAKRGRQ